jgi:hypothetical protein
MYYPLSQIQTNLYTNGTELVVAVTGVPYSGYYWKTSKGEYFSGKTPQDSSSQKLIAPNAQSRITSTSANTTTIPSTYSILKSSKPKIIINSYTPQPTQNDYNVGEFVRYFYKKVNELRYLEISENNYFSLVDKDPQYDYILYTPFYVNWQLTGDKEQTYNVNKNMVQLAIQRQSLYQFDQFLKEDYLKFYK